MPHYDWSITSSVSPEVALQRHLYWHIITAVTELATTVVSVPSALSVIAKQSFSAFISMVYTAYDFVQNNDAQDTIDGSSPVNVGDPVQSQG